MWKLIVGWLSLGFHLKISWHIPAYLIFVHLYIYVTQHSKINDAPVMTFNLTFTVVGMGKRQVLLQLTFIGRCGSNRSVFHLYRATKVGLNCTPHYAHTLKH